MVVVVVEDNKVTVSETNRQEQVRSNTFYFQDLKMKGNNR